MKWLCLPAAIVTAGIVWSFAAAQPPAAALPPPGEGVGCGPCGGCATCVRIPATKKEPHTEYDCRCEDFCKPRVCPPGCGWLFGLAGCADCGKPAVKKVLVKFRTECEVPTWKCKVRRPACAACAPGESTPPAPK
jgi:hypothetical protein